MEYSKSMCARSFEGVKQFDQTQHNFVNLKPYAESSKLVCKLQTDYIITEPIPRPLDVLSHCVVLTW